MQLDYSTRVHQGQARLEDYYAHVIALLSEHNAHEQVMTVARLSVLDLLKVIVLPVKHDNALRKVGVSDN